MSLNDTIKDIMFGFGDNDTQKDVLKLMKKTLKIIVANLTTSLENRIDDKQTSQKKRSIILEILRILKLNNPEIYDVMIDFLSKKKDFNNVKKSKFF